MTLATGWKTYAVAAIAAIIGIDQGLIAAHVPNIPQIPGFVIMLLSAAGLYSVRNAITTSTATTVSAVMAQVAPAVPPSPSVAAAGTGKTLTAKAMGQSYAAFIAAGWTDAELIANGYMEKPAA